MQSRDDILSKAGVVGCEDFGEWINKGNRSKFCDLMVARAKSEMALLKDAKGGQ